MATILAVDDEEFNLDIITNYLQGAGYDVLQAANGLAALDTLARNPVDLIVLDRMMPGINGIDVVREIKKKPSLAHIPIIMQTAASTHEQVAEGIEAGVYYYLAKPYDKNVLLSIVRSAVQYAQDRHTLRTGLQKALQSMESLRSAQFQFHTVEEAASLAYMLSQRFVNYMAVERGLSELMCNAVEHGNLGLGYHAKSEHVAAGTLSHELRRRMYMPENLGKFARLTYELNEEEAVFVIEDAGEGFDWARFIDFDPIRLSDPNGRGIAMTKLTSFTSMEYNASGNQVTCRILLKPAKPQ